MSAYISLHVRHNSPYTSFGTFPFTLHCVQQLAQFQQIVCSKPGPAGRNIEETIIGGGIRPGNQHGSEFAGQIEVHHTIFSPVLMAGFDDVFLTA